MKKTYLIASFLVVGAGAISASALTSIKGSDTIYTVSTDVINATVYPSGPISWSAVPGLTYIGGGSGTGEDAMKAGTQQIAPMSRFLKAGATNDACSVTSPNGSPTTSEGIVIGLDGVSIYLNTANGASNPNSPSNPQSPGCNGNYDTTKNTALGLVSNLTFTYPAGSYITYGGATATYAAGSYTFSDWTDVIRLLFAGMDHNAGSTATNQNCTNPARAALINNYNALLESTGCPSGTCQTITHGFRRDDWSGTSDTVTTVLNLPSIPASKLTDPFCNSLPTGTTFPTGIPAVMQYRPLASFQDFDPIRVLCTSADTNCDQDGTLGWEMVIEPTTDLSVTSGYPTSVGTANMGFAVTGQLNDGVTYYCPNGDTPQFISECLMPLDSSNSSANTASPGSVPIFSFGGANYSSKIDGRVYNKFVHTSAGALQKASNGIAFVAAYFRNYQSQCQQLDASDQIGCFITTPQPCAIGYAGLTALNAYPTTIDPMRLDGVEPVTANVQSFAYPFSRKLYLNTLLGFANVTDPNQLTFAKNESGVTEMDYYISNDGFVPLPSSVTVGGGAGFPYCEDFDESLQCSSTTYPTNSNACANNPSPIPTTGTVCGNGTATSAPEVYERCDVGLANGSSTSNCSATCTCKVGGVDINGHCCVSGTGANAVDCCANPTVCTPGIGI